MCDVLLIWNFFNYDMTDDEVAECTQRIKSKYMEDTEINYFKNKVLHFLASLKDETICNPADM